MKSLFLVRTVLGAAIFLTGCGLANDEDRPIGPFESVPDFKKEITDLTAGKTELIKKLTEDGKTETIRYSPDSTAWAKEMQAFIEAAEFNIAGAITKYNADTTPLTTLKSTRHTFTAVSEKEKVKKVTLLTRGGKTIEAVFEVSNSTPVFSYSKLLTYRPRTGYRIESKLKIVGLIDKTVTVQGVFNREETPLLLNLNIGDETLSVPAFKRDNEFEIINGSESVTLKLEQNKTGFHADFPVFNSKMFFDNYDELPAGKWINYDRGDDYEIPFSCEYAFLPPDKAQKNYTGKYAVTFEHDGKQTPAVAVFDQTGQSLYGTFMTNTGDYRHLSGRVIQDSFRLTTFDGSFAYLFSGSFSEPDKIKGTYHSGNHYRASFAGEQNQNAQLADSKKLTYLKESYNRFDFDFQDFSGNRVSLQDKRFQNKPVLITLMGSWCPNCKDESLFLEKLYQKYSREELEIIGLAFERKADFDYAKKAVEKMQRDLNLSFPVLLTGHKPKDAGKALPALNHVMSFPTLIVLDSRGEVVEIHTGFKGPATGEPYEEFTREMGELIEGLIQE